MSGCEPAFDQRARGKRLKGDARLALELDICQQYRISHSHFLGGPEIWTHQDRDKAIWHAQYKAERCSGCGTHPDDWDPAKGGDRHAYAAVESRCPGCAAIEQLQEAAESRPKNERIRGVRVVLKRRPAAEIGDVHAQSSRPVLS